MTLTAELLVNATGCSRTGAPVLASALDAAMSKYGITTPRQQAHFLAQTAFESGLYTRYVENLNYSADRLLIVFPKYFGPGKVDPTTVVGKPDAIANIIYGGRLGNVDPSDGWRYRGRGFIQLTGRANYSAFALSSGVTAVTVPDWLATTDGAATSAAWFWNTHGCNVPADANDIPGVTRKINGGTNGLMERTAATMHALAAFQT